jgi:predicted Rossmann fold nucleotide-binding protein DprA/Smf involved in DNA uptake
MSVISREMREIVREEPLMHRPILRALAAGPLTVPEIAEAIGQPPSETLVWVMGMRRYGLVAVVPEANGEGLFRYRMVEKETA